MTESRLQSQLRAHELELSRRLTEALVRGRGMNDFLDRFLTAVGEVFAVANLVLYDYDELADIFDLLYFCGYPPDARSKLRRRLHTLDIRRALIEKKPFYDPKDPDQLVVPLYFQETLEAVLVLECPGQRVPLADKNLELFHLVSRFIGLFMSSNRLPVNTKRQPVDITDLERAREVQLAYLPSEYPVTDRYEIYGYNQSSALVGGDYFDYFRQRENTIQCIVADACGHGLAAALIMSTFRGLLHSEVRHIEELPSLFTRLNRQLYCGGEVLQYLTGIFFHYEEKTGALEFFNAGHFDPIVVHQDGNVSKLAGGGPPLGMFRESQYELRQSHIEPGDLLVLFTDGLVELHNARDEFFGVEGIARAAVEHRHQALKELARGVLNTAARFSHKSQPDDDLTLFLMRFR